MILSRSTKNGGFIDNDDSSMLDLLGWPTINWLANWIPSRPHAITPAHPRIIPLHISPLGTFEFRHRTDFLIAQIDNQILLHFDIWTGDLSTNRSLVTPSSIFST
jgi:hypothetical protein